jgi:hypothetical protein
MSAWNMNDGSALTGTHTFTNGSAVVNGNASAVYKSEVKIGDVVTSAAGESLRVKDLAPARTVATSGVNASTNVITFTAHGYVDTQEVTYNAGGGTVMAGLADGTTYFIRDKADDTFKLAATSGGTAIDITGTGNNAQNFVGETNTGMTMTSNMSGSTESGAAANVSRPPVDFAAGDPQINSNILGITNAESVAGVDNITNIAVNVAGARYVQAPTVTVAAPTARTIATAKVSTSDNTITVDAGHNMRTGTKLTYTSGGTNMQIASSDIDDDDAVFVINTGSSTVFKIATSLSNAQAGTAANISGAGNNSQTFVGDTATGTASISGGVVTGIAVTAVGSDYQAVPAVTVEVPKMTIPTSAVNASTNVITFAGHGLSDTDQITYNQVGGGTLMTNVADDATVFARDVTTNTFKIAATSGGTAINIGTGHSAQTFTIVTDAVQSTAVATQGLGDDGDTNQREIAHVGWVKKTVGSGGRAGRVHYETLVAASSMSGDAEDIATPDS